MDLSRYEEELIRIVLGRLKSLQRKINSFWYKFSSIHDHGICFNVVDNGGEMFMLLREISANWDKFSGNHTYPVPDVNEEPDSAFWNKPMWKGEYGENRRDLLEFQIRTLEMELHKRSVEQTTKFVMEWGSRAK